MKNISFFRFIIMLVLFSSSTYSQSKRQIKELHIKTITETTTVMYKGNKTSYKSSFMSFNKKGKQTSKIEYNVDGNFTKKETATYDSEGNKIEEISNKTKENIKEQIH